MPGIFEPHPLQLRLEIPRAAGKGVSPLSANTRRHGWYFCGLTKMPLAMAIGAIALRGVSPSFFVAETQQQGSKLIKCLLLIGSDRLEDDAVAAIQIGSKHSQYAGGREILLAFANRDCALEPDHAPDKLRRRSCVQPELVDNFEFLTHGFKVVFRVVLFRRT